MNYSTNMTTLIQLPNTPEIFAKVERRLAEAIHEEAKYLAEVAKWESESPGKTWSLDDDFLSKTRELRGIRQALKDGAPITVDAAFYWSLTNETATTEKTEDV